MFLSVHELLKGCPPEMKISEILLLSRKVLYRIQIDPTDEINYSRVRVIEAKGYLFEIISKLMTYTTSYHKPKKGDQLEFGMRLKFEEDVGAILASLNEVNLRGSEDTAIVSILELASKIKTVFNFIVVNPLKIANKNADGDIKKHILLYYETVRTNASIIGHSEKIGSLKSPSISKSLVPSPTRLIASQFTRQEKEIEDEHEDEKENEEEDEKEDDETESEDENMLEDTSETDELDKVVVDN